MATQTNPTGNRTALAVDVAACRDTLATAKTTLDAANVAVAVAVTAYQVAQSALTEALEEYHNTPAS